MAQVNVINQKGDKVKDIELNDAIFGIEPNQQVIFDAIVMQQASKRQGTADTKNRTEVRGGGRKPWRQKGTGRARQGSIRSPQWRGGGIVFGPTPRSYKYNLNKKVRRLALKSVLSEKAIEKEIIVVDKFELAAPKTKDFKEIITNIGAGRKTLFVVDSSEDYENAFLSLRNIDSMSMLLADGINVYDIVNANKLVFTEAAMKKVEEVLG
ncbi:MULTISPECIES: 50S ribosomal protein L4 [unclassified Breznakia]|uniref:50S ribosomal protein L4 n=1 Tax=unclassified Breznakia TaxID=2623764 RepID=UPI0024760474|nr:MULTISPECIES: 50S ribosomal protein L4 [unclassified Breznakia]MDH6366125.1 large subunit ribosomal protein L4 [Breznakia sp. PH1-1]MDH6403218.1 large subunit ribosomal protein L4 [Breznakia sp. PF1-11]MDH6410927.1 large subunit ribosomal protein L4 [Breznakia sp. PFB1-11]MDH6413291.1 large subunit ribosomal protein L4 [Breznakia sp. PFB1-14]MDH6416056.1 large subunit ribosomal protein L4 [Breznakia sp. PFB1-4]